MTDTPKLNLRQKLIQVYSEIDHIEKSGRNTKQNYNFVKAADVLRAIRDSFAKLGIYAQTNYELLGTYDIKTNSGGNMHTATVKATIVLYDADSDETKAISGLGDGADSGDKGIFKAQTGATKNALRNGTLLPDEADPEADEEVDDRTAPTASRTYQEDKHDAPRSQATPKQGTERPTQAPATVHEKGTSPAAHTQETPTLFGVAPAAAQESTEIAQAAGREPGDESETTPPTEAELVTYREKFKKLGDDLSADGQLKASKGLPLNRKLLVFLLSITKAADAKVLTKAQWDNFFGRVKTAMEEPTIGLVGITKLVNKANGLDDKK